MLIWFVVWKMGIWANVSNVSIWDQTWDQTWNSETWGTQKFNRVYCLLPRLISRRYVYCCKMMNIVRQKVGGFVANSEKMSVAQHILKLAGSFNISKNILVNWDLISTGLQNSMAIRFGKKWKNNTTSQATIQAVPIHPTTQSATFGFCVACAKAFAQLALLDSTNGRIRSMNQDLGFVGYVCAFWSRNLTLSMRFQNLQVIMVSKKNTLKLSHVFSSEMLSFWCLAVWFSLLQGCFSLGSGQDVHQSGETMTRVRFWLEGHACRSPQKACLHIYIHSYI